MFAGVGSGQHIVDVGGSVGTDHSRGSKFKEDGVFCGALELNVSISYCPVFNFWLIRFSRSRCFDACFSGVI